MIKRNSVRFEKWELQKRRASINLELTNIEYPNEKKMTTDVKNSISSESHRKVVIKCNKGHILKGQFRDIKHCKYCDNTLNDRNTSSILINHRNLVDELDPSIKYDINKLKYEKHYYFRCTCLAKNHPSYKATFNNRVEGKGCPICAGRLNPGYNDFQTVYPELAKYSLDKNKPKHVRDNSNEMNEWKFDKNGKVYIFQCSFNRLPNIIKKMNKIIQFQDKYSVFLNEHWRDEKSWNRYYNENMKMRCQCSKCQIEYKNTIRYNYNLYFKYNKFFCETCLDNYKKLHQKESFIRTSWPQAIIYWYLKNSIPFEKIGSEQPIQKFIEENTYFEKNRMRFDITIGDKYYVEVDSIFHSIPSQKEDDEKKDAIAKKYAKMTGFFVYFKSNKEPEPKTQGRDYFIFKSDLSDFDDRIKEFLTLLKENYNITVDFPEKSLKENSMEIYNSTYKPNQVFTNEPHIPVQSNYSDNKSFEKAMEKYKKDRAYYDKFIEFAGYSYDKEKNFGWELNYINLNTPKLYVKVKNKKNKFELKLTESIKRGKWNCKSDIINQAWVTRIEKSNGKDTLKDIKPKLWDKVVNKDEIDSLNIHYKTQIKVRYECEYCKKVHVITLQQAAKLKYAGCPKGASIRKSVHPWYVYNKDTFEFVEKGNSAKALRKSYPQIGKKIYNKELNISSQNRCSGSYIFFKDYEPSIEELMLVKEKFNSNQPLRRNKRKKFSK